MEVYFLWYNKLKINSEDWFCFDYLDNNIRFFDLNDNKLDDLSNYNFDCKALSDWDFVLQIKWKKILFSPKNYIKLSFDEQFDCLFLNIFDIYFQNIIIEQNIFKKVVPIGFENHLENIDYLNKFAKNILVKNLSIPKIIRKWQYVLI